MSKFHTNCFKTIEVNVENLNTCIKNRFKIMHIFTCQKFCISPVQKSMKITHTEPKIYPDAIEFLLSLRTRCPPIFSSIAIKLIVPRDESSSIAIEPTVSVALRRGFEKAGSVLSDIGDFWDKDFEMRLHQSIFA